MERSVSLRARPSRSASLPIAAALALAAVVGALASVSPADALGVVLLAAAATVVLSDLAALPVLLALTIFAESLALGSGLRVGRLAGAVAIAAVAYRLLARGRGGLRANALLAAVGAYGLWIALSAYWAGDVHAVLRTLFSYGLGVAYMLAFARFVDSGRRLVAVLRAFSLGALAVGLFAFAAFVTAAGTTSPDGTRAAGLQGDPNYFATYQVAALPLALALTASERQSSWRRLHYAATGVVVLSVVASLSRGGLLALVATVLLTLLPRRWSLFHRARERRRYTLALAAAVGITAATGAHAFVTRAESIYKPSYGGSGRLDLWSAAWHGYRDHPWLGLGAGNFAVRALDLLQATPGVNTAAHYVKATGREAHNAYVGTLTDLGPIGLLLFVLVLVLTGGSLRASARRARRRGDTSIAAAAVGLLVSLVGLSVSAVFLSLELDKALFIVAGLALALDSLSRRPAPGQPPERRQAALSPGGRARIRAGPP